MEASVSQAQIRATPAARIGRRPAKPEENFKKNANREFFLAAVVAAPSIGSCSYCSYEQPVAAVEQLFHAGSCSHHRSMFSLQFGKKVLGARQPYQADHGWARAGPLDNAIMRAAPRRCARSSCGCSRGARSGIAPTTARRGGPWPPYCVIANAA